MNLATPTEARRFRSFSNFKSSKRVRWSESRNFVYWQIHRQSKNKSSWNLLLIKPLPKPEGLLISRVSGIANASGGARIGTTSIDSPPIISSSQPHGKEKGPLITGLLLCICSGIYNSNSSCTPFGYVRIARLSHCPSPRSAMIERPFFPRVITPLTKYPHSKFPVSGLVIATV